MWLVVAAGCGEVRSEDVDATPAVDAALVEACAPGPTGPADEDMDGDVDEGCPWSFGKPHVMAPFAGDPTVATEVDPSWVSPDGRRLYMTVLGRGARQVRVASREAANQAFGPAIPLAGEDLGNYIVNGVTLSSDEREAYFAAKPASSSGEADIYRATRADRAAPFGPLELVPGVSTTGRDDRPQLRADGRELLVVSSRTLRRALRISASDAFAAAEDLQGLLPGENSGGFLSRDGRTLFFYHLEAGIPMRIHRAERADAASATFGNVTEVIELEPSRQQSVFYPVLSESTRELFFGSSQSWSPTRYAIWRAELCRTGDCSTPGVTCDGVPSPDGQHCYTLLEPMPRADAQTACRGRGASLASIHSQAEHDFLWSEFRLDPARADQSLWIGGFDDRPGIAAECNRRGIDGATWPCPWAWESGEAWTWSAWARTETYGDEPNEDNETTVEEDCLVLWTGQIGTGKWNDVRCTYMLRGICEHTAYPTW